VTRAKELLAFVKEATAVILSGGVIQGLVSEIVTRPELGEHYRHRIVATRLEEMKTIVDRAIQRGDLRPDTDVRVGHELLVGPLFYRLLFSSAPLNTRHARQLVDAMMSAFAAPARVP
jgi:hypothetical protein